MTQECVPSIANHATSPAANSAASPSIFRLGFTGRRPKRSRTTGKHAVRGLASIPAHQITVPASIRSPVISVAPSASIAATEIPERVSTCSVFNASAMIGRALSPMSEADFLGSVRENDASLCFGVGR